MSTRVIAEASHMCSCRRRAGLCMGGSPRIAARPIERKPRRERPACNQITALALGLEQNPACLGRGTSGPACAEVLGLEQNPREGRAFGGSQATLDEERRGDLSCFVVTSPLTAASPSRRGGRREASTWIPSNTKSRGAVPTLAGSRLREEGAYPRRGGACVGGCIPSLPPGVVARLHAR